MFKLLHLYDCHETASNQDCLAILENMTPKGDDIAALLELAHVYDLQSVLKRGVQVLRELGKVGAGEVVDGDAWKKLEKDHPGIMSKIIKEMV